VTNVRTLQYFLLWLMIVASSSLAWGATISYDVTNAVNGHPTCTASSTASSIVSLTIPGSCGFGSQTLTALDLGWTASITGGTQLGLAGYESGAASFSPTAYISGGAGTGFLQVEYTDVIQEGPDYATTVSISAGDLTENFIDCAYGSPCLRSLTENDAIWSAWIPFTFGAPVTLPEMSASFSYFFNEGPGYGFSTSESVTAFNIADANMNPLSSAYASQGLLVTDSQVPEPSGFFLCGMGLAVLGGYRSLRNR
jgi:hypothetical protein